MHGVVVRPPLQIGAGALALLLSSAVSAPDPYRWLEDGDAPAVPHWTEGRTPARALPGRAPGARRAGSAPRAFYGIGSLGAPVSRPHAARPRGCSTRAAMASRTSRSSTCATASSADRALVDLEPEHADGTVALDWWFPVRDGKLSPTACRRTATSNRRCASATWTPARTCPTSSSARGACSLAWLPDGYGFYYTRYPRRQRPDGRGELPPPRLPPPAGRRPGAGRARSSATGAPARTGPTSTCRPTAAGSSSPVEQGWAKSEVYFKDLLDRGGRRSCPSSRSVEALVRRRRCATTASTSAPTTGAALPALSASTRSSRPARDWKEIDPRGRRTCWKASSAVGECLVASVHARRVVAAAAVRRATANRRTR